MPCKNPKPKRIKRGRFIPLPGGHGSIRINRDGTVLYRAPRRKNPSRRKTKKQLARGMRKMRAWVRAEGKKRR
jgi:hypothetical protein